MSIDAYTAQQRRNRRALTAAQKKGPAAVCDTALALAREMAESNVWPDSWSEVERAYNDAALQCGRPYRSF